MKKEDIEELKVCDIVAYDFGGRNDFRKVKIELFGPEKINPCLKFKNITGLWPCDAKLIKPIDEMGDISKLYVHTVSHEKKPANKFKSRKYAKS
jgi:hypothetical protein